MGKKKQEISVDKTFKTQTERKAMLRKVISETNKKLKGNAIRFGSSVDTWTKTPFGVKAIDDMLGGGIACFIAGTKILMTNYDWKNIEDIKIGDEIIGFNEKTFYLKRSKVLKVFKRKSKEIVFLKTNKSEIVTTKEHPFLTIQKKCNGHRRWCNAIHLNRLCSFYHIPMLERNFDWKRGWILGAILSDGHISKDRRKIVFYNNNIILINKFINNLKQIYYIDSKISNYINERNYRVSFGNKSLGIILSKQKENILKNKLSIFSNDFLRGFIAGYYDGDGGQSNNRISIYSSNKRMLESVKEILNILKFNSKIYKLSESRISILKNKIYISKPEYILHINKSLKSLFTFQFYTKNKLFGSFRKNSIDTHELEFKSISNKRKGRLQKEYTVYNIQTESGTYIANGFPVHNCGHFSVLWGAHGSGKTTLAYNLIAQAQKQDKIVYLIPLEAFDPDRAKQCGVNLEDLVIGEFPKAEECLDTVIDLARKKLVDVIVLDSIHSLSPTGEQEKKSGIKKSLTDDTMAILARKLSEFFRRAVPPIAKANIAVLLIGQTRTNLGGFIALQKLSGGNSLLHNSVLTLHIRRGQKSDAPKAKVKVMVIDENDEESFKTQNTIVGFDVVIKIDKTQTPNTQPELTSIHLPFYYKSGFTKPKEKKERPKADKGKTVREGGFNGTSSDK